MEGEPPGFIKLPPQIAVDINALAAIVEDGHEIKFIGCDRCFIASAGLVLTGQIVVQDGPGPVKIAVCHCHADYAAEQAAAGVPEYLGVLLRRKILFQPEPCPLPIPVVEQIQELLAAPELGAIVPDRVEPAALLTAAAISYPLPELVIGVGGLHRIVDGLQQVVPGQALWERDGFLQITAAGFTFAHQVDSPALAELGIERLPAFRDEMAVVEIGGGIRPARQVIAAFAVSIYHAHSPSEPLGPAASQPCMGQSGENCFSDRLHRNTAGPRSASP